MSSHADPSSADHGAAHEPERRTFLGQLSKVVMLGGLATSYGTCAYVGGRFLYPAKPARRAWVLVGEVRSFERGGSKPFRTPSGSQLTIARQGAGESANDFIALSSICPHLGCRVNWEAQNARFFCPCHNGAFDASGKAIAGPPAEAGQSLARYPLEVRDGLLFIEVELDGLARASSRGGEAS